MRFKDESGLKDETISVEALKDGRLVVWSVANSRWLFNNGFYGKPLGNPKPKEDFQEPLVLDPVEGAYLLEKGKIDVKLGSKRISIKQLTARARKQLQGFDEKYIIYKDLRDRGLIVTPGIKYGCDFAVYEHGPGIDHAPYIIQVKSSNDEITAAEIVRSGRLASTVKKNFIIAVINNENPQYLEFKWWKA